MNYIDEMIKSGEIELLNLYEVVTLNIEVATPGPMSHCIAIAIVAGMSTKHFFGFSTERYISVSEIAQHINRNKQWVGRVIRMLESDGFVERLQQSPPNLGYELWRLTAKANRWLENSRVVVFSGDRGRVLRYRDCDPSCN